MVVLAPIYVGFVALISRRNLKRARAAIMLAHERDTLVAELVMAKRRIGSRPRTGGSRQPRQVAIPGQYES